MTRPWGLERFRASLSFRSPALSSLSVGLIVAILLLSGPTAASIVGPASRESPNTQSPPGFHNNRVSPPPSVSSSGAYDGSDGYVLMFGGLDSSGATLAATWAFTRGNWSQLTVVGGLSPPARYQSQMAFDAIDGVVVMFGGCADGGCHHILDDTWTFAHGQWTNVTDRHLQEPPGRDRGAMVYDGIDGYVLLFGGEQPNGSAFLNDSWAFRAGTWSRAPFANASRATPSARAGAAMVYDAARNVTVLFGGNSVAGVVGDTWTFRAGNWSDRTAALLAAPDARYAASAAYDSWRGAPLVVNGYNHGTWKTDTWGFDGASWTPLSDSGGPLGSYGGLLVDDPGDGYVVYFSGIVSGGALLTSTLLYDHGNWVLLIDPPGSSVFPLVSLLLPLVLFPLIFGISLPIANWVRRRRERQLAEGAEVAPGELIHWVETPRPLSLFGPQLLAIAIIFIFPAVFLIPYLSSGPSLTGALVLAGLFAAIYGVLGLAMYLSLSRSATRAVGVVSNGVIVRRKSGELRVAWDNLQPSIVRPQNGRYIFQFLFPGKAVAMGGFVVTVEQARAIMMDSRAPPWVVPRVVSEGLNMPPRSAASVLRATPASNIPGMASPVAPPTAGAWARPLSSSSYPAPNPVPPPPPPGWTPPVAPPPPQRGVYPSGSWASSPPATPWPSPESVRPYPPRPTSPPPPPGTTPCRKCGQLNPTGRVAFCRSCGQRLV